MDEREARKILEEFLQGASQEDIRELERILEARRKSPMHSGAMDINSIARNMAQGLSGRMGLSEKNIKRMARDMVIRLAREHKPDITDAELRALVRQMVPGSEPVSRSLPPDAMLTMVGHFILFSTGAMSEEEKRAMPRGWADRYWEVFPPQIRNLIKSYLAGEMEGDAFWNDVKRALGIRS